MVNNRKYFVATTVLLVLMTLFAGGFFVWAEDEEEDEDEDENYSQSSVVKEVQSAATSTKVEKPTTSTSVETKTTTLRDSDGDGILDKDDPHPAVAEIYIVEDNNLNGIVDRFEK